MLVIALYFSFLFTALLVLAFMKIGARLGMMDEPNPRKVHHQPVPRTGGAAIVIGIMTSLIFLLRADQVVLGFALGTVCILLVGTLDDLWGLDYKWKFLGQLLAVSVMLLVSGIRFHTLGEVWPGSFLDLGMLSLPLSMLFLLATTNMINLSDGLDGLAGGICLLIFCTAGFLAYFQEDFRTLALCVCTVGAIAGFLRYNTYPAIVFMGDTGSQFLGFTAGITIILLTQGNSIYSPIIAFYLIGVPMIDTSMVILQRLLDRRPVFEADKRHLHHKLLELGFRHNESVIVIYLLQLFIILVAWCGRFADDTILLVSYLCLLGIFVVFFSRLPKHSSLLRYLRRHDGQSERRKANLESKLFFRETISQLTWYGLLSMTLIFYLISPLLIRPAPKIVGVFYLAVLSCLLLLQRFKTALIEIILMLSLYFIAIYYIFAIETNYNSLFLQIQVHQLYNGLLLGIGACYVTYVITTLEKIPFSPLNCLMFGVVVLIFFLPSSYLKDNHLRSVAAKVFLIFLCIDLFFNKYKKESLPSWFT